MFTRGQPGEEDKRGESMVQKHKEKLQQEKENLAMAKLQALMPQVGSMVRALALAESNWSVEEALGVLKRFHGAHADKLADLQKRRRKIMQEQAAAAEEAKKGSGPESSSSDGSSSDDSDSDSDSDADKKRRSRKSKRKRDDSSRERGRSSKRSKRSRSSKDKDKDASDSKKQRRFKDKDKNRPSKKSKTAAAAAPAALTASEKYGSYGIVRETDYAAKRREFILWAWEVKKIEVDNMPKFEEKELFKEYIEDYNTATMPHKKYYDLDIYERRKLVKAAKRAAEGAAAAPVAPPTAADDEEALRRERHAARLKWQQERMQEAYTELKYSDKAHDMREQELLRAQAALAYKVGDTAKAQRIMERLQPDDPREEKNKK